MTLLVDVDGVIITGSVAGDAHWSDGLATQFDFDAAALREHFFDPFWADVVTGRKAAPSCLARALDQIGSTATAAQVQDYWFATDARINAAVLDWIDDRRRDGWTVKLATNQDHDRAAYLMTDLGLNAHVDGIYHSARLGCAKPDPAFFDAIAQAEGKPPRGLTLIDDTNANVTAARTAGWRAIVYRQPADLDLIARQ